MDVQPQESRSEFWEWFDAERRRRRLSVRAIEAASGGTTGRLYKRMNRGQPPTVDSCRVIAAAFGLPLDEVLRRAGFLPEGEDSAEILELCNLARVLTPGNLETVLTVARALAGEQSRSSEPASYRVIGLSRKPWSRRDWRLAVESLTPEERAGLLRELAAEGFPVRDVTADEPEPEGSDEPGSDGV